MVRVRICMTGIGWGSWVLILLTSDVTSANKLSSYSA